MSLKDIKRIILTFFMVLVSIRDSLRVIFCSVFVKNKRAYINRIVHVWAQDKLAKIGVKYKIFNPYKFEFNSDKPYIIMSNHASHFDIPLIYCTFPDDSVAMLAKKELFKIPLFGRAMKLAGCVSIDRENKRQAVKDLRHAIKTMLSGVRLWVSPEGTRSVTGEIGNFKSGGFKIAMQAKAMIVPVTINGSNKILPTKSLNINLNQNVDIHIGKPIDTTSYKQEDLKTLISDTKCAIQKNLNFEKRR